MVDGFILKRLTKTGKKAYYAGQIALAIAWVAYYVRTDSQNVMQYGIPIILGVIAIMVVWAGICLLLWRKPTE